jgi:hypothetical protein
LRVALPRHYFASDAFFIHLTRTGKGGLPRIIDEFLVHVVLVDVVKPVHARLGQEADTADQTGNGTSSKCTAGKAKEMDGIAGVVIVREEAVGFADVFGQPGAGAAFFWGGVAGQFFGSPPGDRTINRD